MFNKTLSLSLIPIILLIGTAYIAYLSLTPYRLNPQLWSVTSFVFMCLLFVNYQLSLEGRINLSAKKVMLVAFLLHLFACIGQPFMEDDYYRYLWDGMRFFEMGTPYGAAPSGSFQDKSISLPFQEILDQINYPDIPTIYAPMLQYVFLLNH